MAAVLEALPLAPDARGALQQSLGAAPLTLGEFLKARELHKRSGVPYEVTLKAFKHWLLNAGPDLSQLDEAATFRALGDLLPATLARQPLSQIVGLVQGPPFLRKRLFEHAHRTIGEFLALADQLPANTVERRLALDAFKDWLETELTNGQPRQRVTGEVLLARLEALAIPDLRFWPAAMVVADGFGSLEKFLARPPSRSLERGVVALEQAILGQRGVAGQPLRPVSDPALARLQRACPSQPPSMDIAAPSRAGTWPASSSKPARSRSSWASTPPSPMSRGRGPSTRPTGTWRRSAA